MITKAALTAKKQSNKDTAAMQIQLIPLNQVARDVYQPRRADNPKREELKMSISHQGQRDPVIVSETEPGDATKKKYVIVAGGNTRHQILEELGIAEILCRVIPHPGQINAIFGSIDENHARAGISFGDLSQEIGNAFILWQKQQKEIKGDTSKSEFVKYALTRVSVGNTLIYLSLSIYDIFNRAVPSDLTRALAGELTALIGRYNSILEAIFGADNDILKIGMVYAKKEIKMDWRNLQEVMTSPKFKSNFNQFVEELKTGELKECFLKDEEETTDSVKEYIEDLLRDGIIWGQKKNRKGFNHEAVIKDLKKICEMKESNDKNTGRQAKGKSTNKQKAAGSMFSVESVEEIPSGIHIDVQNDFASGIAYFYSNCMRSDSRIDNDSARDAMLSECFNHYKENLEMWAKFLPGLFGGTPRLRNFEKACRWFVVADMCAQSTYNRDNKNLLWKTFFEKGETPADFGNWLVEGITGCNLKITDPEALVAFQIVAGGNPYHKTNDDAQRYLFAAAGRAKIQVSIQGNKSIGIDIAVYPVLSGPKNQTLSWASGFTGADVGSRAKIRLATSDKGRLIDPLILAESPAASVKKLLQGGSAVIVRTEDFQENKSVLMSDKNTKGFAEMIADIDNGNGLAKHFSNIQRRFIKWQKK